MNLQQLNPRQREAVKYIDSPLLVLAGAGSGKTRVITTKIAYLIEVCGIKAHNIAAVTFTNKASKEMKERIASTINKKKLRGLKVSTFHTLGLNIIRQELKHIGLRAGFSIYDSQDSVSLLKEISSANFSDEAEQIKQLQWKISSWKNALVDPAKAMSFAEDKLEAVQATLYKKYQMSLQAYNAIDFDDLIFLPVDYFKRNPDALARWQKKIHYLLVDEYQDTNGCQYEMIKMLLGGRNGLTVVGDDDQSIYAWRGAQPENLAQLNTDYENLKVIKLEQNYRSVGRILKVANTLIDNNPHVFQKSLWSDKGYGDPIKVIRCKNDEHEAERVVSDILAHRFQKRTKYSDYAILYRGNHQSRLLEKALRNHRIPYFLSGGTSFFEKTEVRDIMAYLRIVANYDDDAAFLRVVNTPRREIGPSTLAKLSEYAQGRGISLFRASNELGVEQSLSARAIKNLRGFTDWISGISEAIDSENFMQTLRKMVAELDYETWLIDNSDNSSIAEKRMENVNELLDWIENVRDKSDEESTLSETVNYMSLMNILERQEEENDEDAVNLSTLHASKGLEFPFVYIIGMEEELLPHRVSIDEGNIEEERRLAYVGITRAQQNLTLSYTRIRKKYGERVQCEISRFVDELPQDDLLYEGGKQQVSPEEQRQRGKAHLANLKGLLSD